MSIIGAIFTLAAIGVILWLINTYIPMEAWIKKVINILAVVLVVFSALADFHRNRLSVRPGAKFAPVIIFTGYGSAW